MRTPKEYLYRLLKKQSEKAHRPYYRSYYKNYLDAYDKCPDRKDGAVMRRELKALRRYWGVEPLHYYRYGLYRSDCPLSLDGMKEYVPDFFAYYLFFPLSFRDRNVLCEDKKLMHALNAGMGIAQPRALFFTGGGRVLDGERDPAGPERRREILDSCLSDRIFVKPSFGVGGKGIAVFERENGGFTERETGRTLDAELLESLSGEDCIVQEGVRQHPLLDAIYPHAVNTFRIVTRLRDGRAEAVFSLLRTGRGGMRIDNASKGGLYLRIDDGVLAASALADDRSLYAEHPDTGFRFGGYRLPMWDEVKAFTLAAAEKYAPIEYIGWDVAYSADGPVMIEGNNGPGVEIIQDVYGGIAPALGIADPSRYWYSRSYSLKNL